MLDVNRDSDRAPDLNVPQNPQRQDTGVVLLLEKRAGSLARVGAYLARAGVYAYPITEALFTAPNLDLVARIDALVLDGAVSRVALSNAIESAALNGIPRMLRIVSSDPSPDWVSYFEELRPQRSVQVASATVLSGGMARALVAPNPDEWPPTTRMARALTWRCGSNLVVVEDGDHRCWRVMMPSGKMHRIMLAQPTPAREIPDKAVAALTVQRVVYRSWRVKALQRLVCAF